MLQGTSPVSFVAVNGIAVELGVTLIIPIERRAGLLDPNTVPVEVNEAVPVIVDAFVNVDVRLVLMVRPV